MRALRRRLSGPAGVLGITATEEAVYEFLIDRGSVAIDDILETGERAADRRSDVPRRSPAGHTPAVLGHRGHAT